MNKYLIAGLIALATVASAQASRLPPLQTGQVCPQATPEKDAALCQSNSLPSAMLGEWCYTGTVAYIEMYNRRATPRDACRALTIKPTHLAVVGNECRAVTVRSVPKGEGLTFASEDNDNYAVKYHCAKSGKAFETEAMMTLFFDGGVGPGPNLALVWKE